MLYYRIAILPLQLQKEDSSVAHQNNRREQLTNSTEGKLGKEINYKNWNYSDRSKLQDSNYTGVKYF